MGHINYFLVFLLLIIIQKSVLTFHKWDICPSLIVEEKFPRNCSALLDAFNGSSHIVDNFTSIFIIAMENHEAIEDAFDTAMPLPVIKQLAYEVAKANGQDIGIENPEAGATLVAEAYEETVPNFSPHGYMDKFGKSVGLYLMTEGILKDENVQFFAEMYIDSVIKSMNRLHKTPLHGLVRGMKDFLTPIGLYTADTWDTWHSHVIYTLYGN